MKLQKWLCGKTNFPFHFYSRASHLQKIRIELWCRDKMYEPPHHHSQRSVGKHRCIYPKQRATAFHLKWKSIYCCLCIKLSMIQCCQTSFSWSYQQLKSVPDLGCNIPGFIIISRYSSIYWIIKHNVLTVISQPSFCYLEYGWTVWGEDRDPMLFLQTQFEVLDLNLRHHYVVWQLLSFFILLHCFVVFFLWCFMNSITISGP